MNPRTLLRSASFVPLAALSILLAACSSKEERANQWLTAYQAAAATGNLQGARDALAMLVTVIEDNPEYWAELGQLHAQAGDLNGAYFAFTRAHELDRGNVGILQALTQLALRGGNLDEAERFAEQLELLAPSDVSVKLTRAYVALRRGDPDTADRYAEELLALSPYDSSARILKARVLLRQDKPDAAVGLLREQVRLQPSDAASLNALVSLLWRSDSFPGVVSYGKQLLSLEPDNPPLVETVVEAALRAEDFASARTITLAALEREQTSVAVTRLLKLWSRLQPQTAFNEDVRRLATDAPDDRKLVLASYLNDVGDYRAAADIVRPLAVLPVTVANGTANATYAMALLNLGETGPARDRADQVLRLDTGHPLALRASVELALRAGQGKRAIKDAQRLVSVAPSDSSAWILMSKVYASVGNEREAGRTLWNAFHQLSGDRNIYDALRVYVMRTQGDDGVRRLAQEFADQRDAEMMREFV